MPNFKLWIGQLIEKGLERLLQLNYKWLPFVPNGRLLALDLKRAGVRPLVILDVGANIGQTAVALHRYFPGSRILCFEPVASTYRELVANTKKISGISCFQLALGDRCGESLIFKSPSYSGIASLQGAGAPQFDHSETISLATGESICRSAALTMIDLLKIDTEGYELPVLKGFGQILATRVKFIYIEVGFVPGDPFKTSIVELLNYLTGRGFITTAFYNPYRVGKDKLRLSHQDMLLTNTQLVDV